MWHKPEESNPQSSPDSSSSAVPSPQSPVAAALPVFPNAPACLGRTITIKGEISGQDDLFLDGTFEGKIHIAEGSFTAGPNARVNAEIDAREIIVRGEVIGALKARERVQVWSTGKVTGATAADGSPARQRGRRLSRGPGQITRPLTPSRVAPKLLVIPSVCVALLRLRSAGNRSSRLS